MKIRIYFSLKLAILSAVLWVFNLGAFAQTNLCPGDSLGITLTGYTGSIQWEISIDGFTWSAMPGQTSALMLTLPTMESWYRAEVIDGTCDPVYSDTTHVIISSLVADAGPDTSFCAGGSVQIGGSPTASGGTAPYTYMWSPSTGLSGTTIPNPDASPSGSMAYFLAVTDASGCVAMDTVLVDTGGAASPGVDTFYFAGVADTFIVPPCVDSITIECFGAQGGTVTNNSPYPQGGLGARMKGTFAVVPGQVLTVVVGGKGNDDPSSAGGGGGSGVADGNTPMIIAGGGAGRDFQDPSYAGSDAVITLNGVAGNSNASSGGTGGNDGVGTIYSSVNYSWGGRGWLSGSAGSFGQDGISPNTTWTYGTFGLGGGGGSVGYGYCNCGAGGGGYSGGGSGAINQSGGGGGSYNVGSSQSNSPGANTGDGKVIISW